MVHDLLFALKLYALASAALIFLSAAIGFVRRFIERKNPTFRYPQDVPAAEARVAREGYVHRCLVALDVFMNVVFLFGNQSETMSTHAWRASLDGKLWGKLMNCWLNGFQNFHGPRAAAGDLQRVTAEAAVLKRALGL